MLAAPPVDWRTSPHHAADEHFPTESETPRPYTLLPRNSGYGSEPPSVEDAVDVWGYEILRDACQ